MKRQILSDGKILISFQRDEMKQLSVMQLMETLRKLPPEVCKESGNKYNYIVTPDVLSLTRDIGYGPFTEAEWIQGELACFDFMRQFDEPIEI